MTYTTMNIDIDNLKSDDKISPQISPNDPASRELTLGKVRKQGKTFGAVNSRYYLWEFSVTNRATGEVNVGKYKTISDFNEKMGYSLNSDHVRRIRTLYRVDETSKLRDNSFLSRWGNIQIRKIKEEIEPRSPPVPRVKVEKVPKPPKVPKTPKEKPVKVVKLSVKLGEIIKCMRDVQKSCDGVDPSVESMVNILHQKMFPTMSD